MSYQPTIINLITDKLYIPGEGILYQQWRSQKQVPQNFIKVFKVDDVTLTS